MTTTALDWLARQLAEDGVSADDAIAGLRRLGFKTHEARAAVEAYAPAPPTPAPVPDPGADVLRRAEANHRCVTAVLRMVAARRGASWR